MDTLDDDALLLRRIQADDPAAFDQFVERYGDRIYGFGMRVCGEREDARDVAQETLLKAFQSLKEVKEPKALRSWLYRVASNFCLMKRRKGRFEPQRELSLEELMPGGPDAARAEIPDVTHLPEDEAALAEVRAAVRAAIDELPQHYRIVLVLRDMEELTTEEAALALDLPESTIKMRLHRARLMLRNAMAGRFDGDGPVVGSAKGGAR